MIKQFLASTGVEILGGLCGLAAAAAGDYVLMTRIVEKTGQVPLALGAALAFSLMVMFVFVEAAQRLAERLRRRVEAKEAAKQSGPGGRRGRRLPAPRPLSPATRIFAVLSLLALLSLMISELIPPGALK